MPSGTYGPPAVASTQWFQNTKIPMLNKNCKFHYAVHVFQGVTSHQQHYNQINWKTMKYSLPKDIEIVSQIQHQGHLRCAIHGMKPQYF